MGKIDHYLKIDYPTNLIPISLEDGGGWLAEIPLLKGCMSDGETPEEALENLREAKKTWLEVALERKQFIPEPKIEEIEHSGKFTLRIPKTLHSRLALEATKEDMSLNQYVVSLLSYRFGIEEGRKSQPQSSVSVTQTTITTPFEFTNAHKQDNFLEEKYARVSRILTSPNLSWDIAKLGGVN